MKVRLFISFNRLIFKIFENKFLDMPNHIFSLIIAFAWFASHGEAANIIAKSLALDEKNKVYISVTSIGYGDDNSKLTVVEFGSSKGYDNNLKIVQGEVFLKFQTKSSKLPKWKFEAGWIIVDDEESKTIYKVKLPQEPKRIDRENVNGVVNERGAPKPPPPKK